MSDAAGETGVLTPLPARWTLAGCIREWRDPARAVHTLEAMRRFCMFAIACGYEDADDCDVLRADPRSGADSLTVDARTARRGRKLCV